MNQFDILKNKFNELQIIDGALISFNLTDYHRDFEVLFWSLPRGKIRVLLKAVIAVNYLSMVKKGNFVLNDEYLGAEQPNPLRGFYWGIKGFILENWIIEENTPELGEIQKNYDFKLYKLSLYCNSCSLSFVFHDLEVEYLF